jgi:hypothetical protein
MSTVEGRLRALRWLDDPLFRGVNLKAALDHIKAARVLFSTAELVAVCPECKGESPQTCATCKGEGFVVPRPGSKFPPPRKPAIKIAA